MGTHHRHVEGGGRGAGRPGRSHLCRHNLWPRRACKAHLGQPVAPGKVDCLRQGPASSGDSASLGRPEATNTSPGVCRPEPTAPEQRQGGVDGSGRELTANRRPAARLLVSQRRPTGHEDGQQQRPKRLRVAGTRKNRTNRRGDT